jgi:hypothetical protein
VRPESLRERRHRQAVVGLADDLEVLLRLEEAFDRLPHDVFVVGEDDPDRAVRRAALVFRLHDLGHVHAGLRETPRGPRGCASAPGAVDSYTYLVQGRDQVIR